MEIITISFYNWYTIYLKVNYIALVLVLFIVIAIFLIKHKYHYFHRETAIIDKVSFGTSGGQIDIKFSRKDQETAYKLWVEMSTRKLGLEFDPDHDVIYEIYTSWYSFFQIARNLMKEIPVESFEHSDDLIQLTEKVLNQGLRPHLTIWQAKFRKWYENQLQLGKNSQKTPQEIQRMYPFYDELVIDLINANKEIINYKELIKEIAFRKR